MSPKKKKLKLTILMLTIWILITLKESTMGTSWRSIKTLKQAVIFGTKIFVGD